tara:strand:+ start:567 stop:785 length:219 start_codon:yes stop_codon:yes gene_type:complete
MVIHNEIFESYRQEVERIESAMRLLIKHRYKIIDLENQLIHSGNINRPSKRVKSTYYKYIPKQDRINNNKNE